MGFILENRISVGSGLNPSAIEIGLKVGLMRLKGMGLVQSSSKLNRSVSEIGALTVLFTLKWAGYKSPVMSQA